MSLIDPVPVPQLADLGHVHFIAIGGVGMSGVALGFLERGLTVSGSDQADSPVLDQLRAAGATVWIGHDPSHLGDASTIVVSSAIKPTNVELVEARRRGLTIIHRSAALSALMDHQEVVAVAGTHGKTTTSAMCVEAFRSAGDDPSYVIGGTIISTGSGSHQGDGRFFVVEADESDGSFLQYPTKVAIITSIEADHLDNWGTPQAYLDGFLRFASAGSIASLIVNADDPGASSVGEKARAAGKTVATYGQSDGCDLRISSLDLCGPTASARMEIRQWSAAVQLSIPGAHNLYNAAAVLLAGWTLGMDPDAMLIGLAHFSGTQRRFQQIGTARGVRVVDDYAHHPTEIAATISSAREVAGSGRVIACFQPHLFTRTRDFAQDFGAALARADVIFVTGVYAAREDPIPGVTGQLIADEVASHGGDVTYVPDYTDLPCAVAPVVQDGDIVLTLGAGSITMIGPKILEALVG